jgi:hypothetical protein
VRVTRPPSFRSQVSDAPDPQRQVPLTRLDPHGLPERLVFEPAGDFRDDVASRQPSLAGTVDIGVAALPETDVTANVVMPAAEILRDVIMVAMRLVGNPRRRTEMDPARHRPPGRVVDDGDMRPVAGAPVRKRRLRPDQERQAAQVHPPERNIARLIVKNLYTGIA